jgi:hypothetical protein
MLACHRRSFPVKIIKLSESIARWTVCCAFWFHKFLANSWPGSLPQFYYTQQTTGWSIATTSSVCTLECEMQIFWTSVQAAWELSTIVQDKWEGRGISLKAQRGIRTHHNKFLCIWWNSSICDIKYTNQKFSFHVLAMSYSCNLLNLKVAKSVQLQFFYPKDLDHRSSSNTLNDWRYVHTVHRFRNPRGYPNLAWFEIPIAPKDSKAHQLTKLWKMTVPTVPTHSSWVKGYSDAKDWTSPPTVRFWTNNNQGGMIMSCTWPLRLLDWS